MKRTLFALIAAATVTLTVGATPAPFEGNESATGDYVRDANGAHMVINAIKHKNGTTTGSIWFQSATTGQIIIVAVDSLTVVGNSGYIHGIVVFDTFSTLVGRHSYHRVVDNGERSGSAPDQASAFANTVNPLPEPITFWNFPGPIRSGNIQVRGN